MISDLDAKLRELKRYGDDAIMFYRSNVFDHSKRVSWLVEEVSSGCFVYDAWRSIVVNNGGDDMLLNRRES